MFMTPDEVADMTGYVRPKDQLKWLQAERFGYLIGADGKPKVLRQVVVARLGGIAERKGPELRLG
ncbi:MULTISPECIES: DUF4224 domain-containing protein [Pseudomonas]|uniref:DUF4224 domain-containing protein n=3 Tax=Pseudomonas syringae group TaxID=136849 RepID=A0A0P9RMP9_9PSED|nr:MULTISPECIES: DUF4224 domain-containing protein [Pseudomonas]KGS15348.1 hypothetical protein OA77_06230 [Pseudomonas coronafaciens]KKI24513.1 hypothetical protein WX98_19390 [Pseudomonas syringae pv. persicae]KPB90074.1 Uncharacterized protein AC502_1872 [Pseudomonas syringae pv. maculicola]KPX44813.1 Uncharacterized protein ALO68_03892 [Pseudomonas syringae pv. helianthi]KPY89601.1 hypothetical protein ALO36_102661 [Pseudomonas syringae pv. tomato]